MLNKLRFFFDKIGLSGTSKSLHLAVSHGFVAILFVLVDFILSKELTVSEFGIWKEVFFYLNLGIPLCAFGLLEGYTYFLAKHDNIGLYFNNLLSSLLLVAFSMFIIIGICNLLHLFNVIDIGRYFGYSLLFPLPFIAFLINKALRSSYVNLNEAERLTKLSFYGALCSLLWICGGVLFLNSGMLVIVPVAIALYFGIFVFPSIFYLKGIRNISIYPKLDVKVVKKMLIYGFPLYLATFAGLLSGHLDKLIVNSLSDDATFAIFSVGAFQIPIFAMISASFSQQIFPIMIRLVRDGKELEAKRIWIETTKKVSLITYPIILIVMFFAEEIIFFIYNYEYGASIVLFKTYLLVALFRNNSYGILLTAKEQTKVITRISVAILGINFIISVILYYYFGLRGIVFGTLLSAFLFNWYILYKEDMILSYLRNIAFTRTIGTLTLLIFIVYLLF